MTLLPTGGDTGGLRSSLARAFDAAERAGLGPVSTRDSGFECLCPVHGDSHASLSVDWKPRLRNSGKSGVVMKCRSNDCQTVDIVEAMGISRRHLYDDYDPAADTSSKTFSPRRSSASRPAASSKPAAKKKPSSRGTMGRQVAAYPYPDENGTLLARFCRHEPARSGKPKEFIWKRPRDDGRGWVAGRPGRFPLYNLPAVVAAVAAGHPVYVHEGEKAADAFTDYLRAHDLPGASTTSPNGAGKWDHPDANDVHSRWVAGAAVVIVCDRDSQGYAHAADVREKVTAHSATVERIVRTPVNEKGADAYDHLVTAGLGWADFEDVPPELLTADDAPPPRPVDLEEARQRREAAMPPSPPNGGDATPAVSGDDRPEPLPVVRDRFTIVGDALCKVSTATRGPNAGEAVASELVNARVQLAAMIRKDMGRTDRPRTTHYDLVAERGYGDEIERAELPAVPVDEFERLSWVADLPWPDVTFPRTHTGRSDVINAIKRTSGPEVPITTAYGLLGWREIEPGRWAYVHVGGAIDKAGPIEDVRTVDIPDELSGRVLPAPPTSDVQRLRRAFLASVRTIYDLPPRLGVPILGAAYRAALGPCKATFYLVGPPTAGKSSVAAIALQHFDPAAAHDHLTTQAGEEGATITALEGWRHVAGDSVFVADDLAPDRGVQRATQRANQLLRSQFNDFGKGRSSKTLDGRPSRPPRSLLILTGEDGAQGSAETRCVYLPVDLTDDVPSRLKAADADDPEARELRGEWMAALIQHLAADYPKVRDELNELADVYADMLRDADVGNQGLEARRVSILAQAAVGWDYALEAAREFGAITEDEVTTIRARVMEGLRDALVHATTAMSGRSVPEQAGDLLRAALISRQAYIEGADGHAPENAAAMGYVTETDRMTLVESWHPAHGADRIGWVAPSGDRLWLDPSATTAAIERAGRNASTQLNVTPRALGTLLRAAGLMPRDGEGNPRVSTPIGRMRVWDVPKSWVYPDDDLDEPPSPPADEPTEPHDDNGTPVPAAPEPMPLPIELPEGAGEASAEPATSAPEKPVEPETPPPASIHPSTPEPSRQAAAQSRRPAAPRLGDRGPAIANDRFQASAVVVDSESAVLMPSGEAVELPELADVDALLRWAATLRLGTAYAHAPAEDGQVWVMPAAAERLGLAIAPPREGEHPAEKALRAAGWRLGKRGMTSWTTVWRNEGRSLRLVVTPWIAPNDCELWSAPDADPAILPPSNASELVARLEGYLRTLGHPFVVSGAVSGLGLLTTATNKALLPQEPVEFPASIRRVDLNEVAYSWRRPPSDDERARLWLHAYDRRGAYLAAASGVALGVCAPEHVQAPLFDRKASPPGMWRIVLPEWPEARLPNLFAPSARVHAETDGTAWVATPTLQVAHDLALPMPRIVEAWLYPTHHYGMKPWYELLRDARMAARDGDQSVKEAVKRTYAAGIGTLASTRMKGRALYRPDWHRSIVATSRANLTRKLFAAADEGHWPLAIYEDCVVYASDDPDPATAAPSGITLGYQLGQWQVEGSAPLADVLPALDEPGTKPGKVLELIRRDTEPGA